MIIFCLSLLCLSFCEPCELPPKMGYDEAMNCLHSRPFKKSVRDDTLKTVKYLYKNYVFQDIVKDSSSSGSPFHVKLDLESELDQLSSSSSFTSDYDFHSSLQRIFLQLGDIGTTYTPPTCYTSFTFKLPVTLSFDPTSKFRLFFKPNANNDFSIKESENSDDGSEILEVNGIKFEDYLDSQYVHFTRDPGTKRNIFLKGYFETRDLRNQLPPETQNMTFFIKTPKGVEKFVTFSWVAESSIDFTKNKFDRYCGYEEEEEEEENERRNIDANTNSKSDNIGYDLLAFHTNEELYVSKTHPNVAVMRLKSFDPTNLENDDSMVSHYFEILHILHDRNVNKLLIDVRGNSHAVGDFCLPFVLAKLLSPYSPLSIPGNSDMYGSESHKSHYCRGNIQSKKTFFDQDRKSIAGIFGDSRKLVRGGVKGEYSQLVHTSCRVFDEEMDVLVGTSEYIESPRTFLPENVIILTDGTCSGACGSFISLFQEMRLGKILTMGGIPGLPLSIGSHKGGLTKTIEEYNNERSFWSNIITCTLCSCKSVEPLPSSKSSFSYTYLETYPWTPPLVAPFQLSKGESILPQSFYRLSSDFHLWDWNLKSDDVWDTCVEYFEICSEWEVKKNSSCARAFDNVEMGNPCVVFPSKNTSKFDFNQCVVKRCISGWYLSEDRTECLIMPNEEDYNHFLDDFPNVIMYSPVFFVVICILCCIVSTVCCYAFYLGKKRKSQKKKDEEEARRLVNPNIPEIEDLEMEDFVREDQPLLENEKKFSEENIVEEDQERDVDSVD